MAEDVSLPPDAVAQQSFPLRMRGFDQLEVRAFLGQVALELSALREREQHLRTRLADAERRATQHVELDEARVGEVLGEEATRLLLSAREGAASIRGKAEENVARILREAQDEAARLRSDAELEAGRRLEQVEQDAEAQRAKAADIVRDAERQASATVEAARARGREMVAEAQQVRERVLADLTRRRAMARQQIEQLKAGRDRLLEAYSAVRSSLDAITDELTVAVPEAREAAAAVAQGALPAGRPALLAGVALPDPAEGLEVPLDEELPEPPAVEPEPAAIEPEPQAALAAAPPQAPAPPPQALAPPPPAPTPPAPLALAGGALAAVPRSPAERVVRRTGERVALPPGARIVPLRSSAPSAAEPVEAPGAQDDPSEEAAAEVEAWAPTDLGDPGPGPEAEPDAVAQPEPVDEPETRATAEVPGAEPEVADGPEPEPEVSDVAAEPEPEPEGAEVAAEPEVAVDPAASDDAEPEPEPEPGLRPPSAGLRPPVTRSVVLGEVVAPPAVEAVEAPEPEAPDDLAPAAAEDGSAGELQLDLDVHVEATVTVEPPADPADRPNVDELFARIKASRAQSVAQARMVLAAPAEAEVPGDAPVEVPAEVAVEGPVLRLVPPAPAAPEAAAGDLAATVASRDEAVAPSERALLKRLKRVLADEQNEALDALRRARGTAALDDVLPAPDAHADRFALAAADEVATAFLAGWRWGGGQGDEPGRDAVDDLVTDLGEEVAGRVRQRVARALDEAGGDADEAAERVRSSYREWRTQQIDGVVTHLALAAFGRGTLAALEPGAPLRWVVDPAGGGCPDADDNALAGDVPCGQPFPTGHVHAPAHPGCRCAVVRAHR